MVCDHPIAEEGPPSRSTGSSQEPERTSGFLPARQAESETILLPPMISVDDHVVECPDLWERWLPAKFLERAPRVERVPWEFVPANRQRFRPAASGPVADFWLFENLYQGISRPFASVGMNSEEITGAAIAGVDSWRWA
jgi:hypothetical protein